MRPKNMLKHGPVKGLLILGLLVIFALALGLGAFGDAAAKSQSVAASAGGSEFIDRYAGQEPVVIYPEKADLSPPLRSLEVPEVQAPTTIQEMAQPRSPLFPTTNGSGVLDPVVQTSVGDGDIPTPILNFDALGNIDGVLPPDTNGDVGPDYYVEMINISFAVYTKTTGALAYGPFPNNMLWSGFGGPCEADNSGDPIVLYDHLAGRWILTQFAVSSGSHECFAISQTGDPTGAYYRYAYNIGGFPDYPKIGVWENSYLATYRNFGATAFDMQAAAYNRAKMLTGDPTAETVLFSISDAFDPLSVDGFLPADIDGPAPPAGTPALFMGTVADELGGHPEDAIAIFELDVDWANPGGATFTGPLLLPTAPFDPLMCDGARDCIPQPGTDQGLDAISDRPLHRLVYRDFGFYQVLVATQTVDENSMDHAGKRWYELRDAGNGWGIFQQGTYAPDAEHRWMGSIAMDDAGNIALGYSVSSDTVYPSIRYTGRLATDPLNVLPQGEAEIVAGSGSQLHTAARWGDYSSMSIDHEDGCTFWYAQEYMPTTGSAPWQTRIASFAFNECPQPAQADFNMWAQPTSQEICTPDSAYYDVTAFAIGDYTDQVTLSASGVPAGYSASFGTNSVTPSANTVMTLTNNGAATTGSYNIGVVGMGPTATHTSTVTLDLFAGTPMAPTLMNPPDGALNQPVRPMLEWSAVSDATGYFVEVATDSGFTNIVDSATVGGTSYQVSVDLAFDTPHYWRVTPQNVCGAGSTSATFSFTTVGQAISCQPGYDLTYGYAEDFDPDSPGWTHSAATGPDTWTLDNSNPSPGSGANAWFSQDWNAPADQRLNSPTITLPSETQLFLQFWNEQNFENPAGSGGCWDGGQLQISTDGGTNWTTLDGELLTDPYDGTGNNGPPAGERMWCGESAGLQPWTNSIVDLAAFAGQDVQFRFRALSDAAAGAEGWYIDDFEVAYCAPVQGPDILVDPDAIASTQSSGTQVMNTMTISNVGDVDLTWSIFEEAPAAPASGNPERLGPTAPAAAQAATVQAPLDDVVQDGGFETGTPNSFWTEASTNFGTPICDVGGCGTGGGTGPHSGSFWTWFGGIGVYEEGSVSQDLTIPVGTATLSFWLEQPVCDSAADYMEVLIDGTQVFMTDGNSARCGLVGYVLQSVDVSAYADGGVHTLEFHSEVFANNQGVSNFFVDDIVLDAVDSCMTPSDIPWASTNPISGTTTPGAGTDVTVTFDSTGYFSGVYTGTLCIESNDIQQPLVPVPLTMTIPAEPAIVVTKTVGTDPSACATTSSIVVGQPNTDVTYCYTVENTGNATFTTHDVVDDQLGVLLSGAMQSLGPGDTFWFTATTNITGTVTNVVTWTAYVDTGQMAMGTATAMVTEEPTDVSLTSFGEETPVALTPILLAAALAFILSLGLVLRRKATD